MQLRAQAPGARRQAQAALHVAQAQALAEHVLQQVQAAPVARGDPHPLAPRRVRHAVLRIVTHLGALDAVDLVEHQQLRQFAGADRVQHLVDLGDALLAQRIGGVDHVQQQICLARLGQGRAERRHQFVRQVAHEADGIGQHRVAAGQRDAPHGRVQGREQLVGGVGFGAGQRVEQGRLAGVGVAHHRDPRQLAAHPRTAHLGVLHLDLLQPLLQLLHTLLQQAAIGFQLGFAGAAQADRTTALALQVGPAAHQPGGHVPQLGQFDLQLAFVAARALGEDVQDQPGAVDHAPLQVFLQVALLAGAERVVDQNQVGTAGVGGGLDLFQLAAADQRRRARLVDARGHGGGDAGTGRARQVGELLQHIVFQRTAGVGLDQQCMFAAAGPIKHPRLRTSLRYYSTSSSPALPPSFCCT
ncbi:hypothetical protein NB717_003804 [Xanthomonas sacchari]|nr:hypothetical protein [Xanthomonas sacchari]